MKSIKKMLRSRVVNAAAVVAGVALGVFAIQAVAVQSVGAQAIQDCSDNSIIKCGASSPANMIAKIKSGNPSDLGAVYKYFGLTSGEYDAFAREAKVGKAYKNGTIVVDGQVVATDAWSIGREAKSYSKPLKIDGKTYHYSYAKDVFNRDSLDAFVWFDKEGRLGAMVLASCGNPMGAKPVTPSYSCNQLKATPVTDKKNTYSFTTDASAAKGATISRVVYDFGDGSAQVSKTSPTEAVTHTYAKTGNFAAKVTVYVKLPSGKEVAVNGAGCAKQITVKEKEQPKPPVKPIAKWQCTSLTATQQTQTDNNFAYTLRANASMTNARLVSADFDFGDGSAMSGVTPASADDNAVSTNHTYASGKSYTVKATLHFQANDDADAQGAATSVVCQATINPPAVLAAATTPQALPTVGAAGLAGLVGGASVLGTLGYRWRISRKFNRVNDLVDRLRR